jgi:hypothetical protein
MYGGRRFLESGIKLTELHAEAIHALVVADLDLFAELATQLLDLVQKRVQGDWREAVLCAPRAGET